jgi:hypothetical protein
MVTGDEIIMESCRRELHQVWNRYGIWILLSCLADIIESDARLVEQTGRFPEEVERKDAMTALIREAAGSPVYWES